MKKEEVLSVIDSVMNNREIDSIRNAILAIRDKVLELPDDEATYHPYTAILSLRHKCDCLPPIGIDGSERDSANYALIDTSYKIDTGAYGAIWYADDIPHWWNDWFL